MKARFFMQGENEQAQKLEQLRQNNQKMKKRLLVAAIAFGGVILILTLLIVILQACAKQDGGENVLPEEYFHPTYEGDIFEYPAYLDKRPDVIMYCASPNGTGRTTSIDPAQASEYPKTVLYLYDFLQIMMQGDVAAYNACFGEVYYKTHQPKQNFSQQMIYEAEIRFYAQSEEANGDQIWSYQLRYKLFENDGSLRRDVGSDAIVPQLITLRLSQNGEIVIEELVSARDS